MADDRSPIVPSVVDGDSREAGRTKFTWRTCIEFPIVLIMFGLMVSDAPLTNLLMYRTCVHSLGYPINKCRGFLQPDRANTSQAIEEAVQEYATFVATVKSVLESLLPAFLSLLLVAWSDRHGRKPLLVWPMFGIALSRMLVVVYAMRDELGPWWFIASCVPYTLTGGFSILGAAATCYVADVTDEKDRSLRLMLVQGVSSAGMALGGWASARLLSTLGAARLLLLAAGVLALACCFTAACVVESVVGAQPGSILTILDFSLIKDMFHECFKWRPNNLRAQILLVAASSTLDNFSYYGLSSLSYLFLREVLHWSLEDYTQFASVGILMTFAGSLVGVAVIQRLVGVGDLAFMLIAYGSMTLKYLIYAFAESGWHMYLGVLVALFGDLSSPLARSFISKVLPAGDIANVVALMCALESLCSLIAPVAYGAVYATTLTKFPGAMYVVSAGFNIVCVALTGLMAYFDWKATSTAFSPLHEDT